MQIRLIDTNAKKSDNTISIEKINLGFAQSISVHCSLFCFSYFLKTKRAQFFIYVIFLVIVNVNVFVVTARQRSVVHI